MTINPLNIQEVLSKAKSALESEKGLSESFKSLIQVLFVVVELMLGRLSKNSKNSSIPPSQDPNRAKKQEGKDDPSSRKKPGGQPGREKKVLEQVADPDEILEVLVNRDTLPKGHTYKTVGHLKRQVFEIILKTHVKEYRLEVVENEQGKRYTADSPDNASRPTQYGNSIKAMSVYMSLYQMIPYARLQDYFMHQAGIPFSEGSVFNFNKEAFDRLADFEAIAKTHLQNAQIIHADETGINVSGKRIWLHNASNDKWALLAPHQVRGTKAMDEIGILPAFKGIMVHDNWQAYFTYDCLHSLCNAHHLRELQAAIEAAPKHTWAQHMKDLLCVINEATLKNGGVLNDVEAEHYRLLYRKIIKTGEEECPLPEPSPPPPDGTKKKRGKIAKTKERNLLERLRDREAETLRFMTHRHVPFTNNRGENDIRMTKVQQKISGCFKTMEGAQIFCRVRSYLLTAQKNRMHATDALNILFQGKLPDFCIQN